MVNEFFEFFRNRDPISYCILAVLCVGWMIVLERIALMQFVYRLDFNKFNDQLRPMLAGGDFARAKSLCRACGKSGLPKIVLRAIETFESDSFRVRHVVTEETMDFFPRIRKRISQLPNLSTLAVLLGVLSCVHGIWESFEIANVLEINLKNYALSKGLSRAMIPLSFSLICTIILMLPFGLLDSLASRLESEYEHSLAIVLNIISPETQPVFGMAPSETHSKSSGSNHGIDHSIPISEGEPAGMGRDTKSMAVAEKKGLYEDVTEAPRIDAVPDEEEII